MANSTFNILDRTRLKYWSRGKALKELRAHILSGDIEWSIALLEKTGYETMASILDVSSWKGENGVGLRNVAKVVLAVLQNMPATRLPEGASREQATGKFQVEIFKLRYPRKEVILRRPGR
jgi:hypothetical protein